jgi:hypothetical protein
MRYNVILGVMLTLLSGNPVLSQDAGSGFKKANFYKVIAGEDENEVNQQLDLVKSSTLEDKEAYEGTLLMKKAGLARGAKKKLNLFKDGHNKLEGIIKKDSSNVEFRFLRLIIQEHSPGILGYKGDLEKDKNFIRANFKKLAQVVQQAVVDYSKTSKVLKLENH